MIREEQEKIKDKPRLEQVSPMNLTASVLHILSGSVCAHIKQ